MFQKSENCAGRGALNLGSGGWRFKGDCIVFSVSSLGEDLLTSRGSARPTQSFPDHCHDPIITRFSVFDCRGVRLPHAGFGRRPMAERPFDCRVLLFSGVGTWYSDCLVKF